MRILLDNCVDRRFAALIENHTVEHVLAHGWDRLANGRLLDAAEAAEFDVLVTVDRNIRSQQNFSRRRISLVTLEVRRIDLDSLRPYAGPVARLLNDGLPPGSTIAIGLADLDSAE